IRFCAGLFKTYPPSSLSAGLRRDRFRLRPYLRDYGATGSAFVPICGTTARQVPPSSLSAGLRRDRFRLRPYLRDYGATGSAFVKPRGRWSGFMWGGKEPRAGGIASPRSAVLGATSVWRIEGLNMSLGHATSLRRARKRAPPD